MLFLLVRRDKPAGCLRIGVPHGEGLTTNGLLRFLAGWSGMLRVPQHERKKINDINSFPFVLSAVEGLLRVFQQPARCPSDLGQYATKCFFC
jgi:hypothetical protein